VAPERATLDDLRRCVLAAQGLSSRFRRAGPEETVGAVRRLSCVQLDSISTVDRSHRLVLGGRVGVPREGVESGLLASGRLVEYWAHEASLVPVEDWPLFRHRMVERRTHPWFGPVIDADPALAARVLDEVRRRGPLPSRAFEGKGRGGMWGWKPAKRMLDALWTAGELVIAGRQGFERRYDLPERVLPPRILQAPDPDPSDAVDALAVKAVAARGALTVRGARDHYRLEEPPKALALRLARLAEEGRLARVAVEDGGPDVFTLPGAHPADAPAPRGSHLLSPFDNLLWDRGFAQRVLGFRHLIEVYKPAPQRVFGYYVLPFLHEGRLVGRADLKADRAAGTLAVRALHLERGAERTAALDEGFRKALERLARGLGVEAPERVPAPKRVPARW
jgi:uncharacterized protein YcaQ